MRRNSHAIHSKATAITISTKSPILEMPPFDRHDTREIEKARMPVRAFRSWIRQFQDTLGVCRMQLGKVSIPSDISKALLEGLALQLTPRHNQSVGKEKIKLLSWAQTFFRSRL